MALNILDHVAIAYQPVWGRTRQLVAVRLRVRALDPDSVDAAHLLHLLEGEWSESAPTPIVAFADRQLLSQALVLAPSERVWLELPDPTLGAMSDMADRVAVARRQGHRLVWPTVLSQADPGLADDASMRHLLSLTPEDVAAVMNVVAQRRHGGPRAPSPLLAGQLYQGVGHRALATHCLDEAQAWGICGWPVDDVLRPYQRFGVPVDRLTLTEVQLTLQKDRAMDTVEEMVHQDPVLTFKLLQLANSPLFGTGREVGTIRQAMMLLGQNRVRQWLLEQRPGAHTDKELLPMRHALVLRARLMEYLMDAGPQQDLRTEIYLTGLFSQLDRLMHEPLSRALQRVPVSERMVSALLREEGAYFAYLDLARQMEDFDRLDQLAQVCEDHEFALDHVNRALIRMLSRWSHEL
jgi:c-di-GMP phosphodiesterase